MTRLLAFAAAFWLAAGSVYADSLAETFSSANRAYSQGNYSEAIRAYETLREAGIDDPDLSFNLASAYGSSGQYGQAIRFFEHTLLLAPQDEDARVGLRRAREALGARQARLRGEAIVTERPPLLEALFGGVSENALAIVLWVAAWAMAATGLLSRTSTSEGARLGFGLGCTVAALLTVVALLGVLVKRDFGAEGAAALVVVDETPLRQSPDPDGAVERTLWEGARLRALGRRGDYVHVRLPDGGRGYVQATAVGTL